MDQSHSQSNNEIHIVSGDPAMLSVGISIMWIKYSENVYVDCDKMRSCMREGIKPVSIPLTTLARCSSSRTLDKSKCPCITIGIPTDLCGLTRIIHIWSN